MRPCISCLQGDSGMFACPWELVGGCKRQEMLLSSNCYVIDTYFRIPHSGYFEGNGIT